MLGILNRWQNISSITCCIVHRRRRRIQGFWEGIAGTSFELANRKMLFKWQTDSEIEKESGELLHDQVNWLSGEDREKYRKRIWGGLNWKLYSTTPIHSSALKTLIIWIYSYSGIVIQYCLRSLNSLVLRDSLTFTTIHFPALALLTSSLTISASNPKFRKESLIINPLNQLLLYPHTDPFDILNIFSIPLDIMNYRSLSFLNTPNKSASV